jgi:HSP20 family protein
MTLIRFNPVKDLLNMEREFDRLFKTFGSRFGIADKQVENSDYDNAVWMPVTDIYEDNNSFKLKLDLPGLSKKDVKITYTNGQLSISGERKQEKENDNGKYHRIERVYGNFFRTFSLPNKIKENEIDAEFKDGQLLITIPKAEEAKPKELEIKVK